MGPPHVFRVIPALFNHHRVSFTMKVIVFVICHVWQMLAVSGGPPIAVSCSYPNIADANYTFWLS